MRGVIRLLAALLVVTSCSAPRVALAPVVAHVEHGGVIWSSASAGAARVLYQDGGQSIPVRGGTLWLFGDTFQGEQHAEHHDEPPSKALQPRITGAVSCTIAHLAHHATEMPPRLAYFADGAGNARNPLAPLPGETLEKNRWWPLGGIEIDERVYVYYATIEVTDAPGPWNFKSVGGGLAVADAPLALFTRIVHDGDWRFPLEAIQVLRVGEYVYLYEVGIESATRPRGLIVARVRPEHIEDPAAYEFLVATGPERWESSRAHAISILQDAVGQVSIAHFENDSISPESSCWVLATSSDFLHPREIALRTAPTPLGPWSEPAYVAVPSPPGPATDLVYCTFLHPELTTIRGNDVQLVLTFCRMLHGDWELSNPEWMRVTLRLP